MDTWLLLRDVELGGERNRVMYILKSRGMAHSNQLREFLLTDHGIELEDVYIGLEGVLTGSSRLAQEAREKAAATAREEEIEAKRRELERARQASEAQIAAIRLEYQAKEDELRRAIAQEEGREQRLRPSTSGNGSFAKSGCLMAAKARRSLRTITGRKRMRHHEIPEDSFCVRANSQTKQSGGNCGCTWPGRRRRASPPS